MRRRPRTATLFPYTTLFRSREGKMKTVRETLSTTEMLLKVMKEHIDGVEEKFSSSLAEASLSSSTTEEERSEEHTSELQSRGHIVCSLLLEKTKIDIYHKYN